MIRYIADSDDDALTLHESSPKAYLVLITNGRVSHSFPLREAIIDLGRDKGNSVVVADQKVSRHHASLNPIDETYILVDQGSANGTYLNGVLVSQPTRLKDQDHITIGDTTFLFTAEMPAAEVIDQPAPKPPIPSASPALSRSAPQFTGLNNQPAWLLVGCLGLIIIGLMLVLAIVLGLFIGRSQTAGIILLLWQMWLF